MDMSDITLSAGVRANLLSLQNTAQLMQTTQNRLATGKKVNSALDNPLSYFTSQSLGSRASDLSALLDSMSNGIQTIQAANNGLTSITSTVQSMQSTLNQALQDKSFQTSSFSVANSLSSGNISFSGGSIGSTPVSVNIMKAGGTPVAATNAVATGSSALTSLTVSGTPATSATVTSTSAPTSTVAATHAVLTGTSAPTTIDTTAKGAVLTGTSAVTSVDASGGGVSFDITTAAGTKTVALSATGGDGAGNYNLSQLETAINGTTGIGVTASDDGNGHLVLTSNDAAGASASVSVGNLQGGITASDLGLGTTSASGTAATAYSFQVNGATVTLAAGSTYNAAAIASQINTDAGSAGKVNATIDGTSGALVLTSTNTAGASDAVTVGSFSGGTASQLGLTTTTANGSAAGTASTVDVSGTNSFSFKLGIDGATPTTITIDQAAVTTYNGEAGHIAKDATALSAQDIADLINDQIDPTGATQVAGVSGGDLTFTSTTKGTSSTLSISNYTSSLATGTSTGIANTTTAATGAAASSSLNFTVNGQTVSLGSGTYTSAQIASAINTQVGTLAKVNATLDTSGKLKLTSTATASAGDNIDLEFANTTDSASLGFSTASVKTNGTDASVSGGTEKTVDEMVAEINGNTSLAGKITASNDNGSLRIQNNSTTALTVTGANSTAVTGTTSSTTIAGDDVRKSLVNQFNTLRDQLNKFADDSSYNGVNLLRGDNLKLTLNETGTSALNIQAKDANGNTLTIDSTSLGIDAATNSDFDSDATINGKLSTLTTALSTLRSQASSFGSNLSIVQNRQNFTNSMINTLQTGGDNLVLADSNQEGANLLALQTRQSLSTTALSLSAQSDQAVLQLFG
jgi:flagellin